MKLSDFTTMKKCPLRQVAGIVGIQAKTVIKYLNKNAAGTREIKLACQYCTKKDLEAHIKPLTI